MQDMFTLTHSIPVTFLRATIVYLVLLVIVRYLPKRNIGSIAPHDILILIVIGGLANDGILGGADSVADFLMMTSVIIGWALLVDWLDYKFSVLAWIFKATQTRLIEHGRILRKNLHREMITEDELWAALRKEGVDDLAQVKTVCLEADGHISVIRQEDRTGSSGN